MHLCRSPKRCDSPTLRLLRTGLLSNPEHSVSVLFVACPGKNHAISINVLLVTRCESWLTHDHQLVGEYNPAKWRMTCTLWLLETTVGVSAGERRCFECSRGAGTTVCLLLDRSLTLALHRFFLAVVFVAPGCISG